MVRVNVTKEASDVQFRIFDGSAEELFPVFDNRKWVFTGFFADKSSCFFSAILVNFVDRTVTTAAQYSFDCLILLSCLMHGQMLADATSRGCVREMETSDVDPLADSAGDV